MNFDYMREANPATEELQEMYTALYQNLEKAENLYWFEQTECGMCLRDAAEIVCRIYNQHYEIGFSNEDTLAEYLCYTDSDSHNQKVSRFLSVVRTEQRDRLEWIRVWGDECAYMEEHPEAVKKSGDRLYLDVKKMMILMLDVTREMCEKLHHMTDLENWVFEERILPGYMSEEERMEKEKQQEQEQKKNRFQFWKRKK